MAKKKVKLKKHFHFFLILLLIGVFTFIAFDYFDFYSDKEEVIEEEEVKQPQYYRATLLMIGDALIHSSLYEDARVPGGGYDFRPMLQYIKPISSQFNLAYYNQETVLGGEELGLSNYPRFNSPYEVGDAFLDAGFNLVSLATNHTMDKGETGVLNSVNYWNSKSNQAITSGQWSSFEEREKSITTVHEINGIKYAFLSYTTWTNGLETPRGKEYLNNVYSDELAASDIEKIRDKVDVIIVAMHWGIEYSLGVSYDQERIANYLASLGVHIIIGAHPHVVEPVEFINDGKTFVIYSLGNFISDQEGDERLTGLMMGIGIQKYVDLDDNVTITLEPPRAELLYTKCNARHREFRVYTYSQIDNSILRNYEAMKAKYQGIVSSSYPELQWGITGAW